MSTELRIGELLLTHHIIGTGEDMFANFQLNLGLGGKAEIVILIFDF